MVVLVAGSQGYRRRCLVSTCLKMWRYTCDMFRAQTAGLLAYIRARAFGYMSAGQGSAVTLSTSAVMVALGQCNGFPWVPITAISCGEISYVNRHDIPISSVGELIAFMISCNCCSTHNRTLWPRLACSKRHYIQETLPQQSLGRAHIHLL